MDVAQLASRKVSENLSVSVGVVTARRSVSAKCQPCRLDRC